MNQIFRTSYAPADAWPIKRRLKQLRHHNETMHPLAVRSVVEHFPEGIVEAADYWKLFIEFASGFGIEVN